MTVKVIPMMLGIGVMAVLATPEADAAARDANAPLTVAVTVDFGKDLGQNFGSLFEVKDAAGRVVAGAGFLGDYNTRARLDRHTLQFFVRPSGEGERFTTRRLPRPDDEAGLYMFDLDGRLFAINEGRGKFFQEWDTAAQRWRRASGPAEPLTSTSDGAVRLGRGLMRFVGGQVEYEGKTILSAPAVGRYNHFYYAQGRLFFYHTNPAETGGFSRIYCCRWTPESGGSIDVRQGQAIEVLPVGSVTWAFGQLGKQVLTVTNYGGVYTHDGEAWRVLREPSPGVSYQVYSMLSYYDRLLLGQYPSGEVFAYDGKELKQLAGFPPRLPGTSPSARECQTLTIYRGELFAGVWPWAEVWRYDRDGKRWHSMGRLFTHPEITDKQVHPYEAESVKLGLVVNHWGQRVTSMIPIGDALMLSTSAKGNVSWDPKYDFLSDSQRREYGAVIQLNLPGNLAAPLRWKEGPTALEFVVHADRIAVRQDGREIGAAPLDPALARSLAPATVAWGEGVFGPLQGKLVRQTWTKDAGRP